MTELHPSAGSNRCSTGLIHAPHGMKTAVMNEIARREAKRQQNLIAYDLKIGFAIAASLLLIFLAPPLSGGQAALMKTPQTAAGTVQEETGSSNTTADPQHASVMDRYNELTGSFFRQTNEASQKILNIFNFDNGGTDHDAQTQ